MRSIQSYKTLRMSWLVALTLALGAVSSTGCYKRQVVDVRTDYVGCITEPRPEPPNIVAEECEGYTACFSDEAVQKLNKYLLQVQRWMEQAEIACKEKKKDV